MKKFLIVGLGYGWEGKILGQIIATVIFFSIGLIILRRYGLIIFKPKKEYIKHALNYGVPLIPHSLSTFLITMIDRVFITNMVGLSETGIYTVGYQIGMIIGVLADSFNKAWTPWLFEKLNEGHEEIKRKIVKFTYSYMFAITGLAVLLSLIAPWFMSFFVGEEFLGSVQFVFWIAIGYSFKGMYYMVTNYIFYIEKTHLLSWLTFVAAGVNIVLNYYLINAFGAIGAAQATTITYLIQFILTWYLASKVYKMPWLNVFRSGIKS
jgi:O-antigen/teichoic acid export membrane protein